MIRRLAIAVAALVIVAAVVVVLIRRHAPLYTHPRGAIVVHYALRSKLLSRDLHEIAVIPPGGSTGRSLLLLLHGRHDPGPLSFLQPRDTGPETLLSNALFAALAALPAGQRPVIVLVDGGDHSYYHDRRDGPWASMVLREVIPDAKRRFKTRTGRIAIGGISMGGYGALHIASLRPSEFCAVGGHSAALWTSPGASAPGAFDDAQDFERNDVFAAAHAGRFKGLRVWMDGGDADPFRAADAAFVQLLRAQGVSVEYHVWPGAHTESYWHAHMKAYLRFYASALATC